MSEETKQKLREANARQMADPALRAHLAQIARDQWNDPAHRAMKQEAMRNAPPQSLETREKRAAFHRGRKRPPETGERIAAAARRRWAAYTEEEKIAIWSPGMRASSLAKPGFPEGLLRAYVDALGVEYEWQKVIGRYIVDVFVPPYLIIEADGDWHHGTVKYDSVRAAWLEAEGYRVVRLSSKAIEAGDFSVVADALA